MILLNPKNIILVLYISLMCNCKNQENAVAIHPIIYDTLIINNYYNDSIYPTNNKSYSWSQAFDEFRYGKDSFKALVRYSDYSISDSIWNVHNISLFRKKNKYQVEVFDYVWYRCNDSIFNNKIIVIPNQVTGKPICIKNPKYLKGKMESVQARNYLNQLYQREKLPLSGKVNYSKNFYIFEFTKEYRNTFWKFNKINDYEKRFLKEDNIENQVKYLFESNEYSNEIINWQIKLLKEITKE